MKKIKTKKIISKKSKSRKFKILVFFTILIALAAYSVYIFDSRLIPTVVSILTSRMKTEMNSIITQSVRQSANVSDLKSSDFYMISVDQNGKINSLSANTVLINEICTSLATDISNGLTYDKPQRISVPIGTVSGIGVFASLGPKYGVDIYAKGYAEVDYETSFTSQGINQTNFQVWLIVDAKVDIINPRDNSIITIHRKVSLVNTVINGEVPPTYLNIPAK